MVWMREPLWCRSSLTQALNLGEINDDSGFLATISSIGHALSMGYLLFKSHRVGNAYAGIGAISMVFLLAQICT